MYSLLFFSLLSVFVLILKKIIYLSIYLFIYLFWLCWVFVAVQGLSLVAVSKGYSSLQCKGFSLWWLPSLRIMGSKHVGSVAVICRL